MKLLYCEKCGDIVSPLRANNKPRWCVCGRHAVWWENGALGILRVHDTEGPTSAGPAEHNRMAYVIGISNAFLEYPGRITADVVRLLNDVCPDTYIFKRIGSPCARFRPGETGDTAWAELPEVK